MNICKKFASQTALHEVNLEIRSGEFFSLLGPSGCGKSTLLRIIAGFEQATSGELYWDSKRIDGIAPQNRPFNMVFQRYALFPHLTVFKNVAFGLEVKNVDPQNIKRRVEETLGLVGLHDYGDRLPETLSGGQAQRVALARAIVNEPKILLLDEPLSALDQKMREHMQAELRSLQRRLGITFIFVTHDQEEALSLSDRIGVINQGRLEQVATPVDLYKKPETHFVAQFVGSMGCVTGAVESSSSNANAPTKIKLPNGSLISGLGSCQTNAQADAFVRPENIFIGESQGANNLKAKVLNIAFKGQHYELQVEPFTGQRLRVFANSEQLNGRIQVDAQINLHFRPEETFIFNRPSAN